MAGIDSVRSVLADQWKEFIECPEMSADTIVIKGVRSDGEKYGTRNKAEENVISNGSTIVVGPGQCMLIVDNGQIVDFCAEAGSYVYDSSTEPSLFYGDLGENLKATFANIGRRFTYGGQTARRQYVYYINTKEILGNKFGTVNPVPFRVVDKNINLDIDIAVRCNGVYSIKVTNPLLFFECIAGSVDYEYTIDDIAPQLKAEFLTALQPAFAKISEMGIRYSALPGHTSELANAMNQELSPNWGARRGIEIVSVGVNSVTASPEDEAMIKEMQKDSVYRDPNMAGARLTVGQAKAMETAAGNAGGAMVGFAGMNFAANAGGVNAGQLFAMGQQQAANQQMQQAVQNVAPQAQPVQAQPANGWTCTCGAVNTGKFCSECGNAKPEPQVGWECSCGTKNTGKFCMECGAKKPEGAPLYKCDKCGWEPEDPKNPPKFCPECGDIFDERDAK